MIFWIIAGAMTTLAVAFLVRPLLNSAAQPRSRSTYELAVYRDQLAEVDRDIKRGVLTPEQADSLRTEVKRRMLAAGEATGRDLPRPADTASGSAPRAARLGLPIALAVGIPAAALGLYTWIGAPGVPSLPFAERQLQDPADPKFAALVEQLSQRLAENPEDSRGWLLLARSYSRMGRYAESAGAYRQAIARGRNEAEVQASLGEVLVAANSGLVVPEAGRAFAAALEQDSGNPRARYYAGVALAQRGRVREALEVWRALIDEAPADAPWVAFVEEQIRQAAASPASPDTEDRPAAPGPELSTEEIETAARMSPQERSAFVQSMVERLASRLEKNPDDLDGWHRLGRAYSALGETAKARAALERAAELASGLPPEAPQRRAVEAALAALPQRE
jgi:cytochrome c-type biogenesis protein CcmH